MFSGYDSCQNYYHLSFQGILPFHPESPLFFVWPHYHYSVVLFQRLHSDILLLSVVLIVLVLLVVLVVLIVLIVLVLLILLVIHNDILRRFYTADAPQD